MESTQTATVATPEQEEDAEYTAWKIANGLPIATNLTREQYVIEFGIYDC